MAQPAPPPRAAQPEDRTPRSVLPGLGGADPRRPVDAATAPWRSLGRVQTELGHRCTGVLIGARSVLTAAHCLAVADTGRLVRPGSVHFMLGYDRGRWAGHARAVALVAGPGFDPARRRPHGADWVVLTLDASLPAERALPLLRAVPPTRAGLMLGGYQQDRPEVLMADTGCRALGAGRDAESGVAMLLHDCAGTRGSSGAPLLARTAAGGWGVAGVMTAASRDAALGVAVPASAVAAPRDAAAVEPAAAQ